VIPNVPKLHPLDATHCTAGGVAALMAAIFIGPRRGRFNREGFPVDIEGHSPMLQAVGQWCNYPNYTNYT
jgi:Ammonia permease